jgi:hypothetical protein
MSDKAQSHREKAIGLEATVRELKGQNDKLASDFAETAGRCSTLSAALEDQKTQASSIQNELEAYKQQ